MKPVGIYDRPRPFEDAEKRREYQREYMRKWYRDNKAAHISYVRNREAKIKAWLKEYKESLGCEDCGESHPAYLEFHHTDPKEKAFSIGRLKDLMSMRMLKSEIAKCRLLCANCHRKRHWNERRGEPSPKARRQQRTR
jgi:hypothetical protein